MSRNRMRMKIKLLLLMLFILALATQVNAQQDGCFTEPTFVNAESGCKSVTFRTANETCEGDLQCLDNYFFEGYNCGEITKEIAGKQIAICNDLQGYCNDQTGCNLVSRPAQCFEPEFFSAGTEPAVCEEGCCVCEGTNSQTVSVGLLTNRQCSSLCIDQGFNVGLFQTGLTTEQCGNLEGQSIASSNISGFVKEGNQPIENVSITISGKTTTTDTTGFYRIISTPIGQSTVTASKPGYATKSIIVTTEENKEKEANISLASTDIWDLTGTIVDNNNNPVSHSLVKIFRPNYEQETTTKDGSFKLENIPIGFFNIEATAFGYGTATTSLTKNIPGTETITIQLPIIDEATIKGKIIDQDGNPINGVQVIVGSRLTTATFDDIINPLVVPSGQYTLSFIKPGYKYVGDPIIIDVVPGDVKEIEIEMQNIIGKCDYTGEPDKKALPVKSFKIEHILGKKQLKLTWERPCPQVTSYIIKKTHTNGEELIIITNRLATNYIDEIEWNTDYTYTIQATYTNGPPGRKSELVTKQITTGDTECENAFNENKPIEFCGQNNNDQFVLRQECTSENKVELVQETDYDCSQSLPPSLCVGPDPINFKTKCATPTVCGVTNQNAEPYGIGFTEQTCYGTKSSTTNFFSNACYYDYTNTIFNQCFSCDQLIDNNKVSCFKIRSENACEKSYNCGAGGTNGCKWIKTPLQKSIGGGYCVEKNYEDTDKCSLCDSSAGPFNNIQCSDDICTSLGSCYANPEETSCETCDADTTCYDYLSNTACSTNDACGLKSCGWINNQCVKDNDEDRNDDCANLPDSKKQICKKDNEAPTTKIQPEGDVTILSYAHPNITFSATDNIQFAQFKTIELCLLQKNTQNICETFTYEPGKNEFVFDTRTMNIDTLDLKTLQPDNYIIEYRSKDGFNNLEEYKSQPVFIDFTGLGLEIIETKLTENTEGSSLDITVSAAKEVTCIHKLINREGSTEERTPDGIRRTLHGTRFTPLNDGLYTYEIQCEDDYGNTETATEFGILIDAVRSIERVLPLEVTDDRTFNFVVKTGDAATCTLLKPGSPNEEMTTTDNINHESTQKSFTLGYYDQYSVRCISQNEPDELPIPFMIDTFLSPPTTSAVIKDVSGRIITKQKASWQEEFFGNASVHLKAIDNPLPKNKNFGVKQTKYCITEPSKPCEPDTPFQQDMTILQTSYLCYLSEDNKGHLEQKKCGTLTIKPASNTFLVQPKEFTHAGNRYLVVEKEPFDLFLASFHREAPIKECKWNSFEFNYNNVVQQDRLFEDSSLQEITETNIPQGIDRIYKKLNWPPPSTGVNIPTRYDDPYKMFIQCKDVNDKLTDFENVLVLKDDAPPKILEAKAKPSKVIDLPQTTLIVKTDDLTRCTYQREGANPQGFPGFQSREFDFEHEKTLILGGTQGEFTYEIFCENGVGNVTAPTNITFEVNYSVLGSITGKSPDGFIKAQSVTLEINTSKQTSCKLTDQTPFIGTGNTHRITNIPTTEEKKYNFPISCTEIGPTQISFTVDRTPPVINSLNDNNETCTTKTASITVNAKDNTSKVSKYNYKLKEQGTNKIIKEEESGKSYYTLKNLNLTEGNNYYWTVKPTDEAGNTGTEKDSDGFTVESPNSTICKSKSSKAPIVTLSKTITSTGIDVSLECKNDDGCELTYGTTLQSQTCKSEIDYADVISLEQPSYVCYTATNGVGRKTSKTVFIDVEAELNKCQTTTDTLLEGCDALLERDSDGDGLPDMWENRYAVCSIQNDKKDTDNDGLTDDKEDCDDDGLTNYEEYIGNSDPTVVDITDNDNDKIPDSKDKCLNTPANENVITDSTSKFYGCGPSQRDTDGDGMNDAYETKYGLDPQNSADGATDTDKDGLTNLEEFRLNTNPTKADTDGDGFKDGTEIEKGTDPLNKLSKPRSAFVIILYVLLFLVLSGGIGFLSWYLIVKKQILQKLQKKQPMPKQALSIPLQTKRPISHILEERRKEELEKQRAKREKIFGAFRKPEEKRFKDILKKPPKSFEKLDRYTKPSSSFEKLKKYTKKPEKTKKKTTKKYKKPSKEVFEKLKKYSAKKTKKKTKKKSAFKKLKKYEKK